MVESLPLGAVDLTRDELVAWGEEFGRRLEAPVVVALDGELGTGKTTLARSICRGVGVLEDVTSPTFAIVNQYEVNGGTVYHLDLYRIDREQDLTNLGWDDIVNNGAIVLVEWAARAGHRLPADSVRIILEHIPGQGQRRRLRAG
ncbi:MAG TPA: tRNA (adenosine(37)-N6)-threonylcarbamoyltransferase complex ATPase subunit type 1 TsaE [Gemmatimonadaceae bacterium]